MDLLRRRIESAKSAVDCRLGPFSPATQCGWKESCTSWGMLRDGMVETLPVYIMIGRVSTIRGGLGFLPPTVWFFWDKANSWRSTCEYMRYIIHAHYYCRLLYPYCPHMSDLFHIEFSRWKLLPLPSYNVTNYWTAKLIRKLSLTFFHFRGYMYIIS